MLPTRLLAGAVCGTAVVPAAVGAAGCLVFKVLVRRDPIKAYTTCTKDPLFLIIHYIKC